MTSKHGSEAFIDRLKTRYDALSAYSRNDLGTYRVAQWQTVTKDRYPAQERSRKYSSGSHRGRPRQT